MGNITIIAAADLSGGTTKVEIRTSRPIDRVWRAITEHQEMICWFFENIPHFKAEAGFHTSFIVESESRSFDHQWTILEVVPQEKIVYDWSYTQIPGRGKVSFVLSSKANETTIEVINEGLNSFPSDIPEFSEESCRAGWNYFLQRLKAYLEN